MIYFVFLGNMGGSVRMLIANKYLWDFYLFYRKRKGLIALLILGLTCNFEQVAQVFVDFMGWIDHVM